MDTLTSITLLEGLRDPANEEAWSRFVQRYEPMLMAFGRKLGLHENDAQDAAQEAMTAFFRGYQDGRYDRTRGRLRSWLFGIAHRKITDLHRKRRELVFADKTHATAFVARIEDPDRAQEIWEREWQEAILRACMEEIRRTVSPPTFRAFELYALAQEPAEKVAESTGLSPHAIRCAKNRILKRIRELRPQMEEIW